MSVVEFQYYRLLSPRLYEVVETHGRVYLVTEWIQGGELYNRITEEGPLTEVYAVRLFKQLVFAVQHMVSVATHLAYICFGQYI